MEEPVEFGKGKPRNDDNWLIHASTDVEFTLKAPSSSKSAANVWYRYERSSADKTSSLNSP